MLKDWERAQQATDKPVKITMPGPLTVADTVADVFYGDQKVLGRAIADALNKEVLSLANAGCKHIQIDEPLFARYPEKAIRFGIENLERAFHNCPKTVDRTTHICCGYPDKIDVENYPKAPLDSYKKIAIKLDRSIIDTVSIEDAHRYNNLEILARIVSSGVEGCAPDFMGLGPIGASKKALDRAGISSKDLGVIELNEAFASQSLACIKDIGLDENAVNIDGGAIALGHPLGATGARITGKAAQLLKREGEKYALATQCIGLGQGIATVLEAIEK